MPSDSAKFTHLIKGLEVQLSGHDKRLGEFYEELQALKSDVKSLGDRAVTSWQVVTRVLLPLAAMVLAALFAFWAQFNNSYNDRLARDVEYGISTSQNLKDKFGGVENNLEKINRKLEEISRTLGLFANTATVSKALLDATQVPKNQLVKSIPLVRNLLDFAKSSRTPLRADTYKRASRVLFNHYQASDQPLKAQVWSLLAYTVDTKTSTDLALVPVEESRITEAKASNNFFEGDVDLSQNIEWKDTIFRDASIKVSTPQKELILDGVRFIDCSFHLAETEGNQKLIQSLLTATEPELSVAINSFKVLPPRASDLSPEPESEPTPSAR